MSDVLNILEGTSLFRRMQREALEVIVDRAEHRRYPPGDCVIRENEPGDCLYVILAGKVEISKTIEFVGRQELDVLGPGDYFGEMSLLDDKPRSAEAIALEPSELLRISKKHFEEILRKYPEVSLNVLHTFSNRLRQTDDKLLEALAQRNRRLQEENERLNDELSKTYPRNLSSENQQMQNIIEMAQKAAASPITVLLLGESGTGKEVMARAIHQWSERKRGPFIPINCAAIPSQLLESELFGHERGAFTGATQMKKGKFELADGGTTFLDEIGDMAEETQAKVLRFLQEQEFERVGGTKTIKVDVRVIAATNRNLEEAMKEGTFRDDLYYRLNVVTFNLPPLRERLEDLEDLVSFFVRRFAQDLKKPIEEVADDAMEAFRRYHWPGNIRELSNVIERAIALSDADRITRSDLSPSISRPDTASLTLPSPIKAGRMMTYQEAVEQTKRNVIQAALEATKGNQSRAAELLQLERTYLSRLMKQFGMR